MLSEKEAERGKEFPINLPNLTSLVCFPIITGEERKVGKNAKQKRKGKMWF